MPDLPRQHYALANKARRHVVPGSEPKRLRGRALQTRNARILARDPLCKMCLAKEHSIITPSRRVDHVKPLHLDGPDTDDNLQGLCDECHNEKTASEATARANGSAATVKSLVDKAPRLFTVA